MMENLWLEANSLGIDFQIISALASGPVEKEVKRILAVPEHLKIAFTVRLGLCGCSAAALFEGAPGYRRFQPP